MKRIFKSLIVVLIFLSASNCIAQSTGQRIFKSKFPTETKDYNQDTYVKIDNTCSGCTDIIVAVESISLDKVIQHAYIKGGDAYEFNYIPVGTYVCKYMWTDSFGRKHYEKDEKTMRFGPDQYGGYIITMEETVSGNLHQEDISENEFFD